MAEMTRNERWLLEQAAKPEGFMPHTTVVRGTAISLEVSGWLASAADGNVWHITDEGRMALQKAGERSGG